jgi:hypothetical protein
MSEKRNFLISAQKTSSDDDCAIKEVYGINLSALKIIISIFVHLITGGMTLLASYWHVWTLFKMHFSYSKVNDA